MAKLETITVLIKFDIDEPSFNKAWTKGFYRGTEDAIGCIKQSHSIEDALQKLEVQKEQVERMLSGDFDLPDHLLWSMKQLEGVKQ